MTGVIKIWKDVIVAVEQGVSNAGIAGHEGHLSRTMRLVILKKTDISCYIFEIRQNTWTTSLVTRAFSIWCHFWISTLILTYTESTHFLLPVYICPIFSSSSLISRNRNANHLCSESESIICTQLNESHNIVLLKKHPSKNTFTMFSTTHKGWGWNIHGDSFLLQYFLSIFFFLFRYSWSWIPQILSHLYDTEVHWMM